MKIHRRHHLWIAVAVAAVALFTLSQAWGQSGGANAQFEGRPAVAGAQGGTGEMAGPPQGGLGVQGSEPAAMGKRPVRREPERTVPRDAQPAQSDRDPGVAPPQGRTTDKIKRGAKRTRDAARHGVGSVGER